MKARKKTNLEVYRDELARIKEVRGLTAENVVIEARNKKNPLHDYFDWDDSSAGKKWRIHQARLLINCIIEPIGDDEKDKVYSYEITDGHEYKHIDEILSNREWRQRIILQAIEHLRYWRQKYERYKIREFAPIMKEISKLPFKVKVENETRKTRRKTAIVTA